MAVCFYLNITFEKTYFEAEYKYLFRCSESDWQSLSIKYDTKNAIV